MYTIVISDATSDDIYPIRKVQKETWLATYPNKELGISIEDIKAYFDDSKKENKQRLEERKKTINTTPFIHTWVTKVDKKVVGFIAAEKSDKHNRIIAMYILPLYQRHGIGKKLMKVALDWLGHEKPIFVNVASYNNSAISFYKIFGFIETTIHSEPLDRFPSGALIPEIVMKLRIP